MNNKLFSILLAIVMITSACVIPIASDEEVDAAGKDSGIVLNDEYRPGSSLLTSYDWRRICIENITAFDCGIHSFHTPRKSSLRYRLSPLCNAVSSLSHA